MYWCVLQGTVLIGAKFILVWFVNQQLNAIYTPTKYFMHASLNQYQSLLAISIACNYIYLWAHIGYTLCLVQEHKHDKMSEITGTVHFYTLNRDQIYYCKINWCCTTSKIRDHAAQHPCTNTKYSVYNSCFKFYLRICFIYTILKSNNCHLVKHD